MPLHLCIRSQVGMSGAHVCALIPLSTLPAYLSLLPLPSAAACSTCDSPSDDHGSALQSARRCFPGRACTLPAWQPSGVGRAATAFGGEVMFCCTAHDESLRESGLQDHVQRSDPEYSELDL